MHAVFADPVDALNATIAMQMALTDMTTTQGFALHLRCGLHVGVVEHREKDYYGPAVNRAARIMAAAHGGQALLSQAVAELVRDRLPAEIALRDLGAVRLRDLMDAEHVYQVLHPQLRQEFPALRSLESTPNNLPKQATSFIGRERELAEARKLLENTRLLTLTGAGGIGKTRLALRVAAEMMDAYQDGVWLVELAALSDPSRVPQTVATVLGLREHAGKRLNSTLAEHLRSKQLLLVLDNAEHLAADCAKLADVFLRQCPHVVMLVTSREGLRVPGEQTYRVPSLSMPDPARAVTGAEISQFESARLFIERAQLHVATFAVTDQIASALASICARLDGIPLAIELAAARVRSMSLGEINNRLDERFRLLTGGWSTALPRQQTLRALIDWSYDLLVDAEQALLCRLSVFAGGWTLEAAEEVCSRAGVSDLAVLDLLTSLADKSLVLHEERNGATRYRLLDTMRDYARDRLRESGEEAQWKGRHLRYFLSVAEEAEPQLTGGNQEAVLGELEMEHDNLLAALAWAAAPGGDALSGLRLAGAVWRFWYVRGYLGEGRAWLSSLLLAAKPDARTAAARAKILTGAGGLARRQGDFSAARALHEEGLRIQRELDDLPGIAASLNALGIVAREQGDYLSAQAMYEESLGLRRELGDRRGIAASLNNLGLVAQHHGDYSRARAFYTESTMVFRELGDGQALASALTNLGLVACQQCDYSAAQALYQESANRFLALRDRWGIAWSLEGLGSVAAGLNNPIRAARIWGAAQRLRREIGSPLPPSEQPRHDRELAVARSTVGEEAFDFAWHEGQAMTMERVLQDAMLPHCS